MKTRTSPSNFLVALSAALVALLVTSIYVLSHGLISSGYWPESLTTGSSGAQSPQVQWIDEMKKNAEPQVGAAAVGTQYLLGVGKADITGPVVELNLMGYANTSQIGSGLRQRIYSRAFIVGDPATPAQRLIYLVLDTQSGDTAIRNGILDGLKTMGPEYAVYTRSNVAVTGTHSHAGPAAWLNYLLPQITAKGFDKQSYQAIVDGTLLSIKRAHQNLALGTLSVGTTTIANGNANRSPWAYLNNPEAERQRYGADTDKTMTLLRFRRASDNKDVGILTWYAVHGTSLLGNNTLVAGDNKGLAAYLFEQDMKTNSNAAPGFVAGFSQANVGDTTPNTLGAWCEDGSGTQCKLEDSTCGGKSQDCHGRGPFFGLNDAGTKSCYEIGTRQYNGAKTIYNSLSSGGTPISGSAIRSLHTFVDFTNYEFTHPNGTKVKTCPAALGYSFAAGTSDGPGAFDFTQGDSGSGDNPLWAVVGGLIHPPTPEQQACQAPKPILLDVGNAKVPYDWTPNIVDIQLMRIGNFIMIVSPGEATTMSGRRWREAVYNAAVSKKIVPTGTNPIVVLGGPANTYTHYIATEEEYARQRYEGASTLYGPHTLNAYINLAVSNLDYLADDAASRSPAPGPTPPDNRNKSLSFITGVVADGTPSGKSYGQAVVDTQASYARGAIIRATFQAANPRNNLRLEGTYAAIEKQDGANWVQVKSDEDWELLFEWTRTNFVLGHSEVTISWETKSTTVAGTYRIRYYGESKPLIGSIKSFNGASKSFTLA